MHSRPSLAAEPPHSLVRACTYARARSRCGANFGNFHGAGPTLVTTNIREHSDAFYRNSLARGSLLWPKEDANGQRPREDQHWPERGADQ
jgi:hypothetical protein